ncbi:putative triglyceride lipase-cholesterol esterase [Syncephalis plumigaleata]|nr:putative triglyceride lipase-cholesterol esterase [Syncephalis plumigaleata]
MLKIPIVSRLNWHDYQGLVITLVFVFVESLLRLIFAFVPVSLLRRWVFNPILKRLPKPSLHDDDTEPFAGANRFSDLTRIWNYPCEEHLVETTDGYVLCLHRIPHGQHQPYSVNDAADTSSEKKPVVLLWHGFMMNSEVFACSPDREKNLAFILADAGFDVWLGNSRGNKYSYKHRQYKPTSTTFWDFSLDELAAYDLPNSVDYILAETGVSQLAYIGFSQGTAQAFASLSTRRDLNKKISLFIALAPATKPPGLENRLVNALAKSSPHFVYLLFGRRRGLSIALFWRDVLPRRLYTYTLDYCVNFLFGWQSRNMSYRQKIACYAHLYSYSSVKTVAHWFQIIGARRFQTYDDMPPTRVTASADGDQAGHISLTYPTQRIRTPIALFYGGCDSLSNIHELLKDLPEPLCARKIDHFEHLDFLWADDAHQIVYPEVVRLLSENIPQHRRSSVKTVRAINAQGQPTEIKLCSPASSRAGSPPGYPQ